MVPGFTRTQTQIYTFDIDQLIDIGYVPTLWHPGFCHAISFDITSVAQMAITITA